MTATGRSRTLGLLVAVAAALGAVVAPLLAASPAAADTCGPAPAGRTAVVVVVDSGQQVVSRCIVVPTGSTGADALFAAIGSAQVRTGEGVAGKGPGFVCGLDGLPATGCVGSSDQPSWVYWHADPAGSWRFAMSSFAGYRITSRCAVEGWRYGTGRAAPRIPAPAVRCDAPAPTAAPVVPPVTTPPSSGSVGAPGSGSGSVTGRAASPRTGTTAPGAAPAVAGATTVPGGPVGAPGPAAAAPDVPAQGAGSTTVAGASTSTTSTTAGPASVDGELASAADPGAASGGPGAGLIVAATLVVGLGAVAVVRQRVTRAKVQDG